MVVVLLEPTWYQHVGSFFKDLRMSRQGSCAPGETFLFATADETVWLYAESLAQLITVCQ